MVAPVAHLANWPFAGVLRCKTQCADKHLTSAASGERKFALSCPPRSVRLCPHVASSYARNQSPSHDEPPRGRTADNQTFGLQCCGWRTCTLDVRPLQISARGWHADALPNCLLRRKQCARPPDSPTFERRTVGADWPPGDAESKPCHSGAPAAALLAVRIANRFAGSLNERRGRD